MHFTSRRAVIAALASLPLIAACDRAERVVTVATGGDPLVDPSKVSARALRRAAKEPRLAAFYKAREWKAAWQPTDAERFQAALQNALAHGIEPARFTTLVDAGTEPVSREVGLTKAALAYGDALAHGLVDPTKLFEIFDIKRNTLDVDKTLDTALTGGALEGWLEGLAPRDAQYAALSKGYLDHRRRASAAQPAAIPEGAALKPGGRDPRLPQIVAALTAGGYLNAPAAAPETAPAQTGAPAAAPAPAPAAPVPATYDPATVAAMKAFQNDHGLNADGVIGADTVAVLNAGPDDRARQIALNMEARRWLSRDVPGRRIDVNTACAFLEYFKGGQRADLRRVVAGKPGDETPYLGGGFKQLVVNPPWNVPDSIAKEEILPKGAAYLAANDMTVVDGRVVQKPGPKAALGLVKFDMQNKHAIYLHDTPSKERFQDNERHFSHGCVRVDDAVGFARGIAGEAGKTPEFDEKLAKGDTATVVLEEEVPVRLLYHTVFVDPEGRLGFRADVYGWDAKVAEALGMAAPVRQGLAGQTATSIGP